MTDLYQALLKGVFESCRRHFPHENVHHIHTLEHAIENALGYLASSLAMSDADAIAYADAIEEAIKTWHSVSATEADKGARKRATQSHLSPMDRIEFLRAEALETVREARALASEDDIPALENFLLRLTEAEASLRARVEERRGAFLTRRYDISDTEIDPVQAEQVLRRIFHDHRQLRIEMLRPLNGLHSREIHFLDVADDEGWRRPLVIRRDRNENLTPGSVADEYHIMRLLYDAGLPVPEPIGFSRNPDDLSRPFLVMERLDARPLDIHSDPAAAERMLEIADLLARYHSVSIDNPAIKSRIICQNLRSHYLENVIPYWEAAWRSLANNQSFAMEWALHFLRNFPQDAGEGFHLVHGDYTARQMLVTDDRLVALLDFELAGPGSPAEDLACIKAEVETVMPWEQFLQRYYTAGGVRVSEATLNYFDIFIQFRNIIVVARGQDIFQRGKIADIQFGVMGIKWMPMLFDQLQRSLEALK